MNRDLLEYARRLAEGARAKLAQDRKRLEEMQRERKLHQGQHTPASPK